MDGNLIESSITIYKDTLLKTIVDAKIFDKVIFLDGNFLDYTKYEISSTTKANLFICLSSGSFEQMNNNNNVGLFSTINTNFVIVDKNDSMFQSNKSGVNQKQSSPKMLTSLYELVNILYKSEDLINISAGNIKLENFGYAYDANTASNNLNLLTLNASQRIMFLAPNKK